MKILQIIYSLSSGGAERFVVDLSNELAEMTNDVVLCTLRDDSLGNFGFYKSEISPKVVYRNLKLKKGFRPINIFFIGRLINDIKPDIVHCHLNLVNYIFPLTFFFPKIKFFHTIHSDASKEVNSNLEYYLRRFYYSMGIIKAITISNETSKSFLNYYKTKYFIEIYNGRKQPMPSDEFEKVRDFINSIRKSKKHVFLHIGRYSEVKNQEMLIKVFNRLNYENKSVALLIIGKDFESNKGIYLKTISSDVIFFLGQKQNVADYYLNTDAFCLSSVYEGMPITLIEALSCGCVPICTPVGGIIDSIENGVTGYLSKSVSEEDFYLSVNHYLNNSDAINREDLKKYYLNCFSIEKCAKHHIDIYKK